MERKSSLCEKPLVHRPRRLSDWINPTGERKVHSLIDKIYRLKNLELAWEKVRKNRGAGGLDGQSVQAFEAVQTEQLGRMQEELKQDTYRPLAVKRVKIPKRGKPGEWRPLGIPTVYDRVCQQALLNRLQPIFEPIFDDANFGYRAGRSTHGALRKIWGEIREGNEWIVDADLKDFFGTVDHEKLMILVSRRVADGRVLRIIESILKAGCYANGRLYPSERGTPQGGVVSPLLSNILLTPFDRVMRRQGYRLTRYCDDWVITCQTRAAAQQALNKALKVLEALGVRINPEKTRIVHVQNGFEFLGYKIKRGSRPLQLAANRIKSGARSRDLYAYPTQKSVERFKDTIRAYTCRRIPLRTTDLITGLNPRIRGWGNYYNRAHVRRLFNQLDRWIVRRIWSHRHKRWRCCGWRTLPTSRLRGELRLASLVSLIPSIAVSKGTSS